MPDDYDRLLADLQQGRVTEQVADTPLFAASTRARATDPGTSHAAAAAAHADAQRAACLAALRQQGGLTADEVDAYLHWRPTTAGRRLGELRALGLIRATEQTRLTRSGRAALVWEAV